MRRAMRLGGLLAALALSGCGSTAGSSLDIAYPAPTSGPDGCRSAIQQVVLADGREIGVGDGRADLRTIAGLGSPACLGIVPTELDAIYADVASKPLPTRASKPVPTLASKPLPSSASATPQSCRDLLVELYKKNGSFLAAFSEPRCASTPEAEFKRLSEQIRSDVDGTKTAAAKQRCQAAVDRALAAVRAARKAGDDVRQASRRVDPRLDEKRPCRDLTRLEFQAIFAPFEAELERLPKR